MRALAIALLAACNVPNVHFITGDGDGGTGDALPIVDAPPTAPGGYIWLRSLSQVETQTITAGPAGIVTPGYLTSTAILDGSDRLTSAGATDMVVASFAEADATNLYGVRHGNIGQEYGLLATLDSGNTPIVSGVVYGGSNAAEDIDVGEGPVLTGSDGFADGYIGAYANGVAEWVQMITGPGDDKFLASARGPSSSIYGAGWFENTATFDSSTIVSMGGRDVFVARFDQFTGAVDLVKHFGSTGREEVSGGGAASVDVTKLVISGFFDTSIDFGGTTSMLTATHGGLDMWVAQLDTNGDGIWAVSFGGPGDDRDDSVVLDAAGDIYMTGTFTTSITMGSFALTSVGGTDHFLAKLDGTNGNVIWAISFGTTGDETSGRIAVDANGHVAFCGPLDGDFESVKSQGGTDALLAEFDASTGVRLWDHVYSTPGDDGGGGVVYGESGDLFASIGLGGPYDFGMPVGGDPNPLDVLMRVAP
jgi:hypothetical protein